MKREQQKAFEVLFDELIDKVLNGDEDLESLDDNVPPTRVAAAKVRALALKAEQRYRVRGKSIPPHVTAATAGLTEAVPNDESAIANPASGDSLIDSGIKAQRKSAAIIEFLQDLGVSMKEIAARLNVNPRKINRIRNVAIHDPNPRNELLTVKLQSLVEVTLQRRLELILHHLPLSVLDTCSSVVVDEGLRAEIREAIVTSLAKTLASSTVTKLADEFESKSFNIRLPDGVQGAVASLGTTMYVVVIEGKDNDAHRLRLLIHELRHLEERLSQHLSDRHDRPESAF